jgi:hypothetical protein
MGSNLPDLHSGYRNKISGGRSIANEPDTTWGDVFIAAVPAKQQVYVGESFVVDYKLYHRVPVSEFIMLSEPSLEGCQKERLPSTSKEAYEKINGKKYHVVTVQRFLVEPQQAGTRILSPLTASLKVTLPPDPHDFFAVEQTHLYTVTSLPVEFNVVPLPLPNQPAGFTGAVGSFALETQLEQDTVQADKSVLFTIRVRGKGNFKHVQLAEPAFPFGLEVYPGEQKDNFRVSYSGYTGEKVFSYTLVSPYTTHFLLPSIQFCYFDPQQKQYKTLLTEPHHLTVKGGKALPLAQSQTLPDSLNIKTRWSAIRKTGGLGSSTGFYVCMLGVWVLYAAGYWYGKHRKKLDSSPLFSDKLAFLSVAKQLIMLRMKMAALERDEFYKQLLLVLHQFMLVKLCLREDTLQKNILEQLQRRSKADDLPQAFIRLVDDLNRTRFSREWILLDKKNEHLIKAVQLIFRLTKEI